MKCILNALQEGRFIELPNNDKFSAFSILASLIEAIPDIPRGTDVAESVIARERETNTGFGGGWAFPHVRSRQEGELLCAVGWSPVGIDYGAADGKPVRVIVMYYIPSNQMNVYLKEVSSLARLLKADGELLAFDNLKDLDSVRHRLLDIITAAVDAGIPSTKARMIKLEARKPAEPAPELGPLFDVTTLVPFTAVVVQGRPPVVLSQDAKLVEQFEQSDDFARGIASQTSFTAAGHFIIVRESVMYRLDRTLVECLAVPVPDKARTNTN